MKLVFFDDYRLGVVTDRGVVDVSSVVEEIPRVSPQDVLEGLIRAFDDYRPKLEAFVEGKDGVPLESVKLRPPVPRPAAIVCMGLNYMEDGTRSEPSPISGFLKGSHAIIGDGEDMILPDVPAKIFEGEGEIALVVNRRAENVPADEAMDYVFGYLNFIDGSARGLGSGKSTYEIKSRATFAPLGPILVTADEIPDPHNLQVRLWNNGELMQDYNTSDMGHRIPRCIEWASALHPLDAGDIVALGTNHGGLHPFQDGDQIELEVEGLGRLHFGIRDELKRSWKRETRRERNASPLGPNTTTPQLSGKYAPEPEPVGSAS